MNFTLFLWVCQEKCKDNTIDFLLYQSSWQSNSMMKLLLSECPVCLKLFPYSILTPVHVRTRLLIQQTGVCSYPLYFSLTAESRLLRATWSSWRYACPQGSGCPLKSPLTQTILWFSPFHLGTDQNHSSQSWFTSPGMNIVLSPWHRMRIVTAVCWPSAPIKWKGKACWVRNRLSLATPFQRRV